VTDRAPGPDDTPVPEDSPRPRPAASAVTASHLAPPRDGRPDLERIARVREHLRALRMLLGLTVLLLIGALVGATATAPLRSLYLHMGLWLAGQCAAIVGVVAALRWLRRRRFGARPCARVARPSDAILYIGACLGGALALLGFLPEILGGAATGVAWAIAGLGLALLVAGLRAALLYVLRP